MSSRYYPVFLDIAGKPVLVVGGGKVALGKVEGLLQAGAQVTLISPQLYPNFQSLLELKRLAWIDRAYSRGDVDGYFLVIIATDQRELNAAIVQECREKGVLTNAVDDPANCDFVMPSVIRRGSLTVAISTGGESPAAARRIREELETFLTDDYAALLDLASEVRQELRARNLAVKPEAWNKALDADLRSLLAVGQREEAKRRLTDLLVKSLAVD
ncbi:MAG TPA: bifunctional precorrin-2 dehydrogenase/sirohydrochlorin ferrochelatase [Dehalococcoidia bacterium]|nr:bifunctional precorrin-2 dehydrogenase/sirohydrochlorin ferrochelatase [Dehalococcoidia bacterium]